MKEWDFAFGEMVNTVSDLQIEVVITFDLLWLKIDFSS